MACKWLKILMARRKKTRFLDTEEVGCSSHLEPTIAYNPNDLSSKSSRKDPAIDRFLKEREFILNVAPSTLEIYKYSFKAFEEAMQSTAALKARIIELKTKGLSPVSINTYLRHVKAFWLWQGREWELPFLREDKKLLPILTEHDVLILLKFRPTGFNLVRAHLAILGILDTGVRASEILALTKEDIDLHNMVLKIHGKGGKERLVPFGLEFRKFLFRFMTKCNFRFTFGTQNNTKVSVRNLERDMIRIGRICDIKSLRPHLLRHTFAINWIKRGGDIYSLSRILGHSNITTTAVYLRSMGIEAIQKAHNEISILNNR